MKALIQKVSKASVEINNKEYSSIKKGLLIFLGIKSTDTDIDIEYLTNKILKLRIFPDKNKKMNYSIQDIAGEILVISQFTLYANCSKGNRPSFANAAKEKLANNLYLKFINKLKSTNIRIKTGKFKENMNVKLVNKGPVTIILES